MPMGWPDDEGENLYKDYYEACHSNDEWSGVRASEIREKIERKEESDSYQGGS